MSAPRPLTRHEVARTGFILGPDDRPRLLALFDERDELIAALDAARNALENTQAQAGLCAMQIADDRRADWLRREVANEAAIGLKVIDAALTKARGE